MNNVLIKYNNNKKKKLKTIRLYKYDWCDKRKKVYIKTKNIIWILIILNAQSLQAIMNKE